MKIQIYLLITIALAILLLSCGPKVTEPSTSSSAGDTGGDGLSTAALQAIIKSGTLASLATNTDSLVTNTLTYLTANASATLEARYATENGAGAKNGTSWANAWAATDLRGEINGISDASATKVYTVLVAGGTYKPVTTTTTATTNQRNISFSMKNHVAIIGGFAGGGGWGRTGTTTFSGDIGTEGSTNDNSYHVFSHISTPLDNGLLYGVTITGGNANGGSINDIGGGMYNNSSSPRLVNVVFADNSAGFGGGIRNNTSSSPRLVDVRFVNNNATDNGGGMYNTTSSPVLTGVEFADNSAENGGGMYNDTSSPVLTGVEFTGNSASKGGGGMYNSRGSSPVLTRVEFTGSSADNGGGMYNTTSSPVLRGVVFSSNSSTGFSTPFITKGGGGMNNDSSSPVLRGVVFVGNSANGEGGGMFNVGSSSPVLVGVVFRGNSANKNGGGMYSYAIKTGAEPVIVNSIFTANSATTGADFVLDRGFSDNDISVRVAGSVLGVGEANATNGIVVTTTRGTPGSFDITYHSLTNGEVDFGDNKTTDTATGGLTYPTIQSSSSAKDIGLYVRKSGTDYYFSEDENTWYTNFTATGGFDSSSTATPPTGAEDLTATDIAGNARVGRPDAGVHEYTP